MHVKIKTGYNKEQKKVLRKKILENDWIKEEQEGEKIRDREREKNKNNSQKNKEKSPEKGQESENKYNK